MDRKMLKKLIDSAAGRAPADLVVKNGKIADGYTGGLQKAYAKSLTVLNISTTLAGGTSAMILCTC
ncbi:MAG: hypothetical protein LBL20_06095 [Treponema sp.]|jgi:adenine deaminase|nr:hypothetical protein [Treponema sp.]